MKWFAIWVAIAAALVVAMNVGVVPDSPELFRQWWFDPALLAAAVLVALAIRWRLGASSRQKTNWFGPHSNNSNVVRLGCAMIATAIAWLGVGVWQWPDRFSLVLMPVFGLLLMSWGAFVTNSEVAQKSIKTPLLIALGLIVSAVIWSFGVAATLPPEGPNVSLAFLPAIALAFAALMALMTPVVVMYFRLIGIVE